MTKSASEPQNFSSLAAIRSAAASTSLVDVMISNVWPEPITQFSDVALPLPELATIGVQPAGDIVKPTKPRYFLAAGGGKPPMFWEREPFVWDDEEGRISRFISLGAFGGEQPTTGKKQRVHHFNLDDLLPFLLTHFPVVLCLLNQPELANTASAAQQCHEESVYRVRATSAKTAVGYERG
jgi:hypothetical protein